MMDPRYRGLTSDEIPELSAGNGVKIKVICGEIEGTKGPVSDIVTDPEYLDVTIPGILSSFTQPSPVTRLSLTLLGEKAISAGRRTPSRMKWTGPNYFDMERKPFIGNNSLVLFDDGEQLVISTEEESVTFAAHFQGKPIGEPVAWYGPIVMNTPGRIADCLRRVSQGHVHQALGKG